MPLPINVVSSLTLEPWDHRNPWKKGIGGSETSHIEMAQRLARSGHKVTSYAPVPSTSTLNGVKWLNVQNYKHKAGKGIDIMYRDPGLLDNKPKGRKFWFIAQDVDYEGQWTDERLTAVDRYICLCQDHADYTLSKYPALKDKVYVSSNGIRTDYISGLLGPNKFKRNPNQLFYPSSPDRGLKFLLTHWFRIREINPKATLKVAYGFDNMESIVRMVGPSDWRYGYQKELEALIKQPGIIYTGRLKQHDIYVNHFESNIWSHPTDFPETSCITCMEAQACGAWPVTNKFWAIKQNVKYGWMVDGIPQKNDLVQTQWLHSLDQAFGYHNEKERQDMQRWALDSFNWERMVKQWQGWLEEDEKRLTNTSR